MRGRDGAWTEGGAETGKRQRESHLERQSADRRPGWSRERKRSSSQMEGRGTVKSSMLSGPRIASSRTTAPSSVWTQAAPASVFQPLLPLVHWTTGSGNPPGARPTCPLPRPPSAASPVTSELAFYSVLHPPSLGLSGSRVAVLTGVGMMTSFSRSLTRGWLLPHQKVEEVLG